MDRLPFNSCPRQRMVSRHVIRQFPKWMRVSDLNSLRDAAGSPHKRIFAIVSRPIPSEAEGKTIRRILIFDNHPDSLRLVSEAGMDLDSDKVAPQREKRISIICGSIIIAVLIGAMLWPLFW